MLWREGEGAARKPQEQAAQLKGVFSEGASVVNVPESARSSGREQPERGQEQALTPEQFQRKAQSRGLWDGGANKAPSQPTQPRAETLPRAVVGTASPNAANSNFQNPSIGNEVSPPLPASLTAAQPMAAGKASLEAAAAANHAAATQRALELGLAETEDVRTGKKRDREETDPDVMDTMELDMAKFIQKGGLPKAPAQAAQSAFNPPAPQKTAAGARLHQQAEPAQPAPVTPPTVAAEAARAQADAAKAPATTEKIAARPTPSGTNSAVLIALIVVAAIIAVLFIGAALGIWHLPWASTGHASLSKTVPAKSLPEMRTPATPGAVVIPTAIAAPAAPSHADVAYPADQAEPAEQGDVEAVAVMAADEAAPLHAAANSGGDPEDDGDRAPLDVSEVLDAARAELRAGHAKEAEALLRTALEANPNDHHIGEALAQVLISRGASIEAVAIAQRIVKKRPKRASYRVLLGDALRRAGDEPNAKAAYREALALDPNLRDAHTRLAKLN